MRLVITEEMFRRLHEHLFRDDRAEHGAIILAGISQSESGTRLLVREVCLAKDGSDYLYKGDNIWSLQAKFIAKHLSKCRQGRLVHLAVHNHGGTDSVRFSAVDLRSHEYGYPAHLEVTEGMPVGALVLARKAVAGDIWMPDGDRQSLEETLILGKSVRRLYPNPRSANISCDQRYDRQSRIFGPSGQAILHKTKVGIIGLGGAGSQLADFLSKLRVGEFVLVDPDRIELSNLPRVVDATDFHARAWFLNERWPDWVHGLAKKSSTQKVKLAKRVILKNNPRAKVEAIPDDFAKTRVAQKFKDCDYLFLAADTARARLVFNAIVHQYLIPGVQVGAKVLLDKASGNILDVYAVVRPVTPGRGCMWCNELINKHRLAEECKTQQEIANQRYVDDEDVVAPSVNTLNAIATSQAANDFLFYITGMTKPSASRNYMRIRPAYRKVTMDEPRRDATCSECGEKEMRYARGDQVELPTSM